MRKPNYGQDITFHWEGIRRLRHANLYETASTLLIGGEVKQKIENAWNEHLKQHPADYDGKLWRFETALESANRLSVKVSPTAFSGHAYLRGQELPEKDYPNPLGITVLQVTADGYAIAGVHSDGRGIVSLESRFIERGRDNDIIATLVRPDKSETNYANESPLTRSFVTEHAFTLALITGSLHDTGIVIYVPVPHTSKHVGLNSNKHSELVMIPTKKSEIENILEKGTYSGVAVADQLLGSLGMFLKNRRYLEAVRQAN